MSKDTKQEEWESMESGGFITFDEPGDGFTGVVTGYQAKSTPKGMANEYVVFTEEGRRSFFSPKDLHDKLSGCIIKYGMGEFVVKVEFIEKVKTSSGNDFKKFEVKHRKKTDAVLKEFGIEVGADDDDSF